MNDQIGLTVYYPDIKESFLVNLFLFPKFLEGLKVIMGADDFLINLIYSLVLDYDSSKKVVLLTIDNKTLSALEVIDIKEFKTMLFKKHCFNKK